MTLRHLSVFLAVCRQESITRAAEALHMTQPAVTRIIQELEQDCGVPLFDRIGRRLRITEAGREMYSQVTHILDAVQRMETGIRKWDVQGLIRVGTTVTIGTVLLPRVLAAFRENCPDLRVQAQVRNGAALQQALLESRLDFALIEGTVDHPDLRCETVAYDRLIPVLPPQHPCQDAETPLQALAAEPLLLRESGSMGRSMVDQVFQQHQLPLQPVLESISTQAILRSVQTGLGIAFLPEYLVLPALTQGLVATCPLSEDLFSRSWHLVWHKHKQLIAPDRALMDCFRTQARLL